MTLVRQLLYWNSQKKGKKFTENNTKMERGSSNTVIAADAYRRWQAAMAVDGFAVASPEKSRNKNRKEIQWHLHL